jgi:hypothetical protein
MTEQLTVETHAGWQPSDDWTIEERFTVLAVLARRMAKAEMANKRLLTDWVRRIQCLSTDKTYVCEANRGRLLAGLDFGE